jgi:hypothetical protein
MLPKLGAADALKRCLSDGDDHLRSELFYVLKGIIPPQRAMRIYREEFRNHRDRGIKTPLGRPYNEGKCMDLDRKIKVGVSRVLSETLCRWKKYGWIEKTMVNGAVAFRLKKKSNGKNSTPAP